MPVLRERRARIAKPELEGVRDPEASTFIYMHSRTKNRGYVSVPDLGKPRGMTHTEGERPYLLR